MLSVLLGELGKAGIDFSDAVFLLGREVGTAVEEIKYGFFRVAAADGAELLDVCGVREGLDDVPKLLVEGDGRVERTDLWENSIERGALLWLIGHGVEMLQAPPSAIECLRGIF